ncbi:MAG: 50S ribosomal protein L22 [Nanoarchaeota archaeon]
MDKENTAVVRGMDLPISTKHSIEICDYIRYKSITKIKKYLELVMEEKEAIPLKRFHKDRGHRKGNMGPGFYPKKATKEFIILLNSLEANAKNQGLSINDLIISKAMANKASTPHKYGRKRGLKTKRTHIELRAESKEIKK